ncbi:hypothetical protein [Candidatus Nitrosocosmicus arcticus]|uniref:Uncharacterized protein n=1 Tax=Candidatus Nitrosocosmicus arcticus TaxID=2035267 RepID=A0A557SS18_9ARCH|nr:hypothetical protein [Candidatus Nitrosocosmicus arcticus]TVP39394.1 exported protein of unknown function [Candidatus Nitrosocosmicus arcticus]
MNRGLKFYGIILVTIATLVFSVNDFGMVHATTGIDLDNNPAQPNPVPGLKSDQNDDNNDKSSSSSSSSSNNNNDDNNNDKSRSSNNNNDDNNNDKSSSSTTTTTTTSSNDDVPMALPFNSNMADESDDEKDYSSVIPFP